MAGDRDVFQEHMNTGDSAAWDQDWATAVKAYSQAVQEMPEDAEAHIRLGLSLLKQDRLQDALKVFSRAHDMAPDDPVPLERSADVLERMGRLKEAAQQYVNVSDVYLSMKDLDKAIGNWQRATQLTPGLVTIHARLAQAYERIGDKRKAVREYLVLAFNFQRLGETEKAERAVERALRLDRRNPHALNTLRALRSGGEITLPEEEEEEEAQPQQLDFLDDGRAPVGEADPLGPMGEAMQDALVGLADYVVTSGSLDEAGGDALQAMQYQRQELIGDAIAAYKRAETTLRHPALKMNLGALYFLNDQPEEAIKHLGEATLDPKLSPGALHALGYSYLKMHRQKQASRYLIQSLQAVDTNLAMSDDEKASLGELYNRLLTALDSRTDEALATINDRFIDLLRGKDWKQRIAETRRHLEEVMRDQGDQGVVDFLGTGGSDKLASTVSRIDSYIRQGRLTLAMDEAHLAVQTSPYYLPVHVRMAEIMMREGRLRQAINKYNTVARSYMSREENDRAASILVEVLEMAPLDVSVRRSLINLLESEGRMEEVLDHYIELARTYNQLGNFDLSRETYQRCERMARELDSPVEKIVIIKHHLADMDQMRLDTRQAIRTYEEILELTPGDERAYRMLVDLNYSIANQVEAIRHLDALLGIYAKKKQISKIVQLLEELVRIYSTDTGLRSRLAAIYRQLNRRDDAIAQLDALGELQLEAGLHNDARNTVKQIIALRPDNLDDYNKLLEKLGG